MQRRALPFQYADKTSPLAVDNRWCDVAPRLSGHPRIMNTHEGPCRLYKLVLPAYSERTSNETSHALSATHQPGANDDHSQAIP